MRGDEGRNGQKKQGSRAGMLGKSADLAIAVASGMALKGRVPA